MTLFCHPPENAVLAAVRNAASVCNASDIMICEAGFV